MEILKDAELVTALYGLLTAVGTVVTILAKHRPDSKILKLFRVFSQATKDGKWTA